MMEWNEYFNWVAFKVTWLESVVLKGERSVPHPGVTLVQAFTSQLFSLQFMNMQQSQPK